MTRLARKIRASKISRKLMLYIKSGEYKKIHSYRTVLVIMAFVVFYFTFIAADRYVSHMSVTVKATDGSAAVLTGLEGILGSNSNSSEDIKYLKEYITSLDMLKKLEKKINIREIYQKQKIDFMYNLYSWTKQESYLKYYQNMVSANFDDTTGLLNIEVQGFSPEDAHTIATAILEESEIFMNELSHNISREQLKFSEAELAKAREKYEIARNQMALFQNTYSVVDPKSQVATKATFITEIELKISQKETELNTMLSYLNESAPQVVALRAELKALNAQLEKEKNKVASDLPQDKLNNVALEFQSLALDFGFAEDVYKAALKAVETTRIEMSRKVKQLVVIQSPSTPESAEYPNKSYNIFTIFIVLTLFYRLTGLIRMIMVESRF